MPANTPKYGLPYPLPAEPVAEGAAAIRALAEALDALLTGKELAYAELTTQFSISATTPATAPAIITLPALTLDGTTRVLFDFFSPAATPGNTVGSSLRGLLFDGSTAVAQLATLNSPVAVASNINSFMGRQLLTPAAGAHTYSLRVYVSGGTGAAVWGGTGTAGGYAPAYLRATRV